MESVIVRCEQYWEQGMENGFPKDFHWFLLVYCAFVAVCLSNQEVSLNIFGGIMKGGDPPSFAFGKTRRMYRILRYAIRSVGNSIKHHIKKQTRAR